MALTKNHNANGTAFWVQYPEDSCINPEFAGKFGVFGRDMVLPNKPYNHRLIVNNRVVAQSIIDGYDGRGFKELTGTLKKLAV